MKYLLLILLFSKGLTEQQCGETKVTEVAQESNIEVTTQTPKHLVGAKITIEKADGTKETVSAEEFMVVKRKHNRPLISKIKNTNTLQCNSTNKKNILSAKVVDGYSDVETKVSAKSATISVDRQLGLGLQYQRKVKDIYLGIGADSNKGLEALLGFEF